MTTLFRENETCFVCGKTNEYVGVGSTNRFGAPDLDTRPPQMMRSTLCFWIRRCPSCGYCAPKVSESQSETSAIVESTQYQQQIHDPLYPELANSFLGWSMLQESIGTSVESAWSCVHAAWACDDAHAADAAVACRSRAVRLFQRAQAAGFVVFQQAGAEEVIMADLLRRSGKTDQAIQICQVGLQKELDETLRQLLLYEIALAQQGDGTCHRVDEASKRS